MSPSPSLAQDRAPREPTNSSSSRESSPERVVSRKPRSFSPESESGDSAAPQITVRDSSPPQDQPVIRQGLAFRSITTKNITTYEPSVKRGGGTFLPGQEVQMAAGGAPTSAASPIVPGPPMSSASPTPGPPASSSNPATPSPHLSAMSTPSDKSAAPKGTKKASKAAAKKVKQTDDTTFTTGRFRLSQYSGMPNDGQSLPGQGTYASVYRAPLPPVEVTPPGVGPEPSSSPATASTVAPIPGTRIVMADASPKATRRGSKLQSVQPTQEESADTSPTHSKLHSAYTIRPPAPYPNQSTAISPPSKSVHRVSIPQPPPSAVSPIASYPAAPPTGYYRRNYEQGSQFLSRSDSSRPPPVQMTDPRNVDTTMAPPPAEISMSQSKGKTREPPGSQRQHHHSEPARPPRGNVRLVTALIEDNRTNPPDHLLAEVYIRCWSGSRPDELWCDAKDLSEELQASASRIDGPAKVFTQRGAYRQCFLRITAEQEDRYNSMNLALASDRTIPISVEYWPGAQVKSGSTADWRMPWHSSPTLPQAHIDTQSPQSQYHPYPQHQHSTPPQHLQSQHHQSHAQSKAQPHHPYYSSQPHNDGRHVVESSRKRQSYNEHGSLDYPPKSPLRRVPYGTQASGHADHDPRYETPSISRNPSSAYPRKRHVTDASSPTDDNMQGEGVMDTRPDYKISGYDSSQSEDVRQVVSEMIEEVMKIDVTVTEYNRLLQTSKLTNTILAYKMVEEIYKKYVGRLLPVKGTGSSHKITEVDIAKGLGAEDPRRFISECRETLWLLELYGEKGKRGENPKVLEMLNDNYHSDFNSKPIKQLQKLLKETDAQWTREHSEGPPGGSDNSRSTTRMS